ncbi:hypothetical protein GCM10023097_63000 [Streptomyces collinus]
MNGAMNAGPARRRCGPARFGLRAGGVYDCAVMTAQTYLRSRTRPDKTSRSIPSGRPGITVPRGPGPDPSVKIRSRLRERGAASCYQG